MSLTARILKILVRIVPWNRALTKQFRKSLAGITSESGCLTEGQDALSIKRDGQLNSKARFHLLRRPAQAADNRFLDFEWHGHEAANCSNDY